MKQNLLKTWLMLVCLLVGAGSAWAEDVTVTKTINQLAQENDWKTSTGSQINGTYRDFNLDDNINIKLALALGEEGNSGSIWGSNSTTYDWRLYQTNSPAITISSKGDYVIKTVKFTYSQNNTGVINTKGCEKSIGSSYQITSGKTHNVNANSVTYYLGNSGTASNGQAKITAFEVVYSSTSGGGEPTGDEKTSTIIFGTNDVKINAASVTGEDNLNNTWTITTAGSTSFTSNASYYQVGSSNKPATSITFTTTLPKDVTITKMSAKFGGFSGTAGTVTLKVGSSAIGTGSLNEANDVTVNSTSTAKGKVLTVTLTNIAKGVKVYNISYTYSDEGGGSDPIGDPEISNLIKTSTLIVETGAEPYDVRNLLNIPNDYDGTITTTIEDLTEKDGEFSCVYPNLSFQTSGTYTVNVTAAAIPGKYAETTGNITVTAKKPLPKYEGTYVDIDLSTDNTETATEVEMTWSNAFVNIEAAKAESSIAVNNYYPGSSTPRSSTRFYAKSTLTFTPTESVTITGIEFTTTSNAYATVFETSDWTNANAIADAENKIAYVTPIDGTATISATIGATTGVTNIRVYYTGTLTPQTITLKAKTDDGYYATFSSDKVTFFPEDYMVSAVGVENNGLYKFSNEEAFDEDIVKINGEDVIGYYVPANTGVLLYSTDENVIYQNVTGVTPSDDVKAVNMLVPTTADGIFKAEADGNYYYKLAYGDNTNKTKLGFWFGAVDGSGNFNVKAGGAVLRVPQIAGVKGFSLSGGDETAIENLMSNNKQKTIYNLQGVKLQKLQKGVNIVNGRKVIR